jgi:hypothetical protein
VGSAEARGRCLLNSFGVSSLRQLVAIGRMWCNGLDRMNFTPHTLSKCFGSQTMVRKPLGIHFMNTGSWAWKQASYKQMLRA